MSEKMSEVYEQYARNPIIADVLNRVKYIEKLGEGWDKIIEEYKKHPLKPKLPDIMDTGNTVIVTLYSPKEMVEKPEKAEPIMSQLNERQKKALFYIIKNKKMTRRNYTKINEISNATAKRDLNDLVKRELFELKGKGRSVYYILHYNLKMASKSHSKFMKKVKKRKK